MRDDDLGEQRAADSAAAIAPPTAPPAIISRTNVPVTVSPPAKHPGDDQPDQPGGHGPIVALAW